MKRNPIKFLAFILSVVMFLTIYPKEALAAEETLYISDIRMANAGSESAAKKELTDAGYTVYDADLNYNTKENFVYIGCKTTTDPTEAITDIKMLKQDNGYQIYDSDAIMGAIAGEALDDAYSLMKIINVFKGNYESGQKNARFVYTALQKYAYSETQNLGDFLLDDELTENDLTDMLLYASDSIMIGVETALTIAMIDDSGETWLNRIAAGVEYTPDNSLRGKARKVLASVKGLVSVIYTSIDETVENYDENSGEVLTNNMTVIACDILDSVTYKDGTLLQWMLKDEPTSEDFFEIAASMTEAEIEAMKFLGMAQFAGALSCQSENSGLTDEVITEEENSEEEPAGTFNFWEGSSKTDVERIGVTNDAIREMTICDKDINPIKTPTYIVGAGMIAIGIVCTSFMISSYKTVSVTYEVGQAMRNLAAIEQARWGGSASMLIEEACVEFKNISGWGKLMTNSTRLYYGMSKPAQAFFVRSTSSTLQNVAKGATTAARTSVRNAAKMISASVILDIILFLIVAGFVAYDIYEYYDPDYTEFPKAMLSLENDENGKAVYVHYDAVKKANGDVGDTNSYQGKAWNAMYFTKSDTMGTPIKADSLVSSLKGSSEPVSEFGHYDAYNMNTNAYHDDSSVYIYFTRADADTLASIFAPPLGIGIIVGSALIIGGTAAAIIVVQIRKKKAKVSAPAI